MRFFTHPVWRNKIYYAIHNDNIYLIHNDGSRDREMEELISIIINDPDHYGYTELSPEEAKAIYNSPICDYGYDLSWQMD